MSAVIAGGLALLLIALAITAWAVWMVRSARRHELELRQRLDELEKQARPIPGVDAGEKRWEVTVGGEQLPIRALNPAEWARALEELPDFLFSYAVAKQERRDELKGEELEGLMSRARDWIAASAPELSGEGVRPDLARLTVPEAMDAVVRISRLNGLDESLAAWFRDRLDATEPTRAGPDGEKVRREAQRAPRGRAN